MFARLLLLGFAGFLMAAQTSCSVGDGEGKAGIRDPESPGTGTNTGNTFATTLTLKDSSGRITGHFSRGELITFELTVLNRTDAALDLSFPSSGGWHDFRVFDRGTDTARWAWQADKLFAAVVTKFTVPARGSQTFTGTWDQVSGDGIVPRGPYDAWGVFLPIPGQIPGLTPEETQSPRVTFSID